MKAVFIFLILSLRLEAYPQMALHGYVSCTACHVSPAGGGILSPYGKGMSHAILSAWGSEEETHTLSGLIRTPGWLQIGGDTRLLQSYLNAETVEQAKVVVMQADTEAAVTTDKLDIVGTLGYNPNPRSPFISRRHYATFRPTDEISLRVGRFLPNFGFQLPDHFLFTRGEIGFGQGTETYNAEVSWAGETANAFLTGVFAKPRDSNATDTQALSVEGKALFKGWQLGLGAYAGKNDFGNRMLAGPRVLVGLTSWFTVMAELNAQRIERAGNSRLGFVNLTRLELVPVQGFQFYLSQEYASFDLQEILQTKEAYTTGVQWFVRPHIEIGVGFRKQKNYAVSSSFFDMAWGLMHYYL